MILENGEASLILNGEELNTLGSIPRNILIIARSMIASLQNPWMKSKILETTSVQQEVLMIIM